jgi:hypothetical protein
MLAAGPVPNGSRPVPANTIVAAQAKTSAAGPTGSPSCCSGAMKAGVPAWARVPPPGSPGPSSSCLAMPKSITRGPTSPRSTLAGLRSRWMTPAAWIAARAPATPTARPSRLERDIGPRSTTTSWSVGPLTYSLAIHGIGPSRSASSTGAVQKRATRLAASTSRRKRSRRAGWPSRSARIALTAARPPSPPRPR